MYINTLQICIHDLSSHLRISLCFFKGVICKLTITRLSTRVLCVLFTDWKYGMDILKHDLSERMLTGGKSSELSSGSAAST